MTSRSAPPHPASSSKKIPRTPMVRVLVLATCLALTGSAAAQPITLPAAPAGVQTFTDQGIQFSRVQAAGVQPVVPVSGNLVRPIGGRSWDFGLSRTEITQGQWVEFINAFNDVPVPEGRPWTSGMLTLLRGSGLGPGTYATGVGSQGRQNYAATELGAMLPMASMTWYGAAAYCNWLQSGRQVSLEALNGGAYDLSGWDQLVPATWPGVTRQPGARYFIPSYDEWAVAAFYDQRRYGPDSPGWWSHLSRLDRNPVPGSRGVGETAAGWDPPQAADYYLLPVASYPGSQSPWGLLDTSGTYSELLDDMLGYDRRFAGTESGPFIFPELEVRNEQIGWAGAESPIGGGHSFRIATAIPAPSAAAVFAVATGAALTRRRRS